MSPVKPHPAPAELGCCRRAAQPSIPGQGYTHTERALTSRQGMLSWQPRRHKGCAETQQLLRRQVTQPACKGHISNLLGLPGLGRATAPPHATHSLSLWHLLQSHPAAPAMSSCSPHPISSCPAPAQGPWEPPKTGVRIGPNPHPLSHGSEPGSSGLAATMPLERSLL